MRNYQININNIEKNKVLFLIYTPFQLFSSLNIIDSIIVSNEIHIIIMHENIKRYTNTIKHFYNVQIYEYDFMFNSSIKSKKRIRIHLDMIKKMCEWKIKMNYVDNSKISYNQIFVPSDSVGCNVVFSHFYNINKEVILNVFDDGIGTYQYGYLNKDRKYVYALISKFIFGNFFWRKVKVLYGYKPELIDKEDDIKIYQLKMSDKVKEIISLDATCDYHEYQTKKLIYLDQGELENMTGILDKFFDLSKQYFSMNLIVAKKHPRLASYIPNSYSNIDNSGTPFESICSKLDNDNFLIVSLYSTACITPYMLFNLSPYIIFLGRIDNNDMENVFESTFMKTIIKEYEPGKLFIPRTFEELELNLKFISNKLNEKENSKSEINYN